MKVTFYREIDVHSVTVSQTRASAVPHPQQSPAVPPTDAHGGGSIVNVGSMWAHQAIKATPSSAYSMAKAGLHALTQHLAMELAEANIRVNAIAPAVVNTA